MKHQTIINFWFKEIDKKQWFKKDPNFDQVIRDRFLTLYDAAKSNELFSWRKTAYGRLAEIIVLDQFSRNLFRGSAEAFSNDSLSLCLAQEAVAQKVDKDLSPTEKSFLYMPYMHSESLIVHQQAVKLFSSEGLENNLRYELKHKEIIERFSRYPHRNEILGRRSTTEEIEFLTMPGSSF